VSFLSSAEFWIALSQIILINIVLSGDNAVVIAMASRSLPPAQQKKAILFGSVGAIVLRVVLTFFAVYLLTLPYLKLLGAALLGWVAGEMAISDPAIAAWVADRHSLHTVVPALGAMLVVAVGKWLSGRREQRREQLQATKKQAAV